MISGAQLGHGIGLRTRHYDRLLSEVPRGVDWFEVISENFFAPGGRPWAVLDRVRSACPVALHGVSLCIGDAEPLSRTYMEALARVAERVEPAWISDHLSWGASSGRYAHDLLPLPFTEEALDVVVAKVSELEDRLGRSVLLENVSSYMTFPESRMPEWEFLNEVARRSGCGILLDVNNVFVNAKNHGFSAEAYVDGVLADRVGQIHVAGHTDMGEYLLDTHVGPVPDPVWALYGRFVRRAGAKPTLVEWDEDVPDLDVVVAEADRARAIEREVVGRGG